jgi:hypothetical protein
MTLSMSSSPILGSSVSSPWRRACSRCNTTWLEEDDGSPFTCNTQNMFSGLTLFFFTYILRQIFSNEFAYKQKQFLSFHWRENNFFPNKHIL